MINRGFAETMALKRSAGLETVACWQTDAQWTDREVRDQLDALFAHRVYFATASARDARAAVALTMAEFSDTVRPGIERLSTLGHPDVRLHLPKHHAIASWSTPRGTPVSVRRRDDPAGGRSRAPRAARRPPARARRAPSHRSASAALGSPAACRPGRSGGRIAAPRSALRATGSGAERCPGTTAASRAPRRSRRLPPRAIASWWSSTAPTACAGPGGSSPRARSSPIGSTSTCSR